MISASGGHPRFMCGDADCGTGKDSEDDVFTHMSKYYEGPLKIRKLCIDEKTGDPYYQSHTFTITIAELGNKIQSGYQPLIQNHKLIFQKSPTCSPVSKKLGMTLLHLMLVLTMIYKLNPMVWLKRWRTCFPAFVGFLKNTTQCMQLTRMLQMCSLMEHGDFYVQP